MGMSGFAMLLEAAVERQVMDERKEVQVYVARIQELENRLSENEKTLKGIVKAKKRKRRPVKRAGVRANNNTPLRKCQNCKVVKRSMEECGPVRGGRCLVCVRTGRRCLPSYDRRRKDVVGGRWHVVELKKNR